MGRSPCFWSWPVKLSSSRGVMLLPALALYARRKQSPGETCSAVSGWMPGSVPSSARSWWGWVGSSPCSSSPLRQELLCGQKVSLLPAVAFLKVLGCDCDERDLLWSRHSICSALGPTCQFDGESSNTCESRKELVQNSICCAPWGAAWSRTLPHTAVPALQYKGFFLHSSYFFHALSFESLVCRCF